MGGPALLLTRISGWGQAASSAFCPSAVATSAATGITLTPTDFESSTAAVSSFLASRPLITTSQPASAKARAQALPSPRLDAQTMALRPAIPRFMGFPHITRGDGGSVRSARGSVKLSLVPAGGVARLSHRLDISHPEQARMIREEERCCATRRKK